MIQPISVNPPKKLHKYTEIKLSGAGLDEFPFLSIDRDSYMVQAEVQSGLDFRPEKGCHCIAIGRGSSLADDITFIIDMNHEYCAVAQGVNAFLDGIDCAEKNFTEGLYYHPERRLGWSWGNHHGWGDLT